jgi:uncharacterized protein YecT (DUF1311 family)
MNKAMFVLAALLIAGPATAQITIQEKKIVTKTKTLEMNVHYPYAGRRNIDNLFANAARTYAASVQPNEVDANSKVVNPHLEPSTGYMGFEVKRNDAQMLSIQVDTGTYYAGQAHPNPDLKTYNFLMPEGRLIGLADLVDGKRGMERVRDLAVDDLDRQLLILDDSLHLKAQEDWFSNFVWKAKELQLTFPPYSVAGYRTTVVHIPLFKLKGVIRPNPRVPAASFDCAVASSRIEKALCSDAGLARLDRQVAERFLYWLGDPVRPQLPNETASERYSREISQRYHDQKVVWQRAWIASRNHNCSSGSVACLKSSYEAHLRDRPPH